jgi:hypothetical protein
MLMGNLRENVLGDFNPRMKLEADRGRAGEEQVKFDAVQRQTYPVRMHLDYYDGRGICPGMAAVKSGCN